MCLREIILSTTLDFYLLFREKIVREADLVRKNMCEYFIGQCRKYLHKHNISVQDFRANASVNILEDRRGSRHFSDEITTTPEALVFYFVQPSTIHLSFLSESLAIV